MDFDFIERVVRLVESSEVGELEVESGEGLRVVVKKNAAPAPQPLPPTAYFAAGYPPAAAHASSAPAPASAPASSAPAEVEDDTVELVKAPMVGTFYRAPAPDAPPFIDTGDVVQKNTVVCILEAMKVMNEIKANAVGTVAQILVENGQPVEYGQPLFKIKKK
ncbi:MAG: acetyl-CoA carboxylase biotin carboxyl carrier protein [bacterium]|nr:acetyl-CoA carboxylase biotin carboxyl carrier protein [bacterium]